ncbi:MAG: TOBE domain-containing protein, partial [Pseudomonadota bacterium]
QNSFVAQFIGENNRLQGRVKQVSGKVATVELEGGGSVTAEAVNVGADGTPTTLSLRPERVEIEPKKGSLPNILSGEIRELIYLGDHIRTRMRVAGNEEFIVKVPNSAGNKPLAEGATVTIGWKSEDCKALDPLAA